MSNDQGNQLNEQELIAYIAGETNVDAKEHRACSEIGAEVYR